MSTLDDLNTALKCLRAYERERDTYLYAHANGGPPDAEKLKLVDQQIANEEKEVVRLSQLHDAACNEAASRIDEDMNYEFAITQNKVRALRDRRELLAIEIDKVLSRLASLAVEMNDLGLDLALTAWIPFDRAAHPAAADAVDNAMRLRALAQGLKWVGGDRPARIPLSLAEAVFTLDSEFMVRQTAGRKPE